MKSKFHLYMLRKSLDFMKDKIIYHENAHLLIAYFFGLSCKHVSYVIDSKVQLIGSNLEVEFESQAHAYINLPPILEQFLHYNNGGGNLENFCRENNVTSESLLSGVRIYTTVLYAGYEAEKKFFGGLQYFFIRMYIKKYSADMTVKDMREDYAKISSILENLHFDSTTLKESEKKAKSVINQLLKTSTLRDLFSEFHQISKSKKTLQQFEIEEILSNMNYREWADKKIVKIN
jgi:virulence-associated protein VapD